MVGGKYKDLRVDTGRTNPTISTLFKISQALEITVSELVNVE